MIKTTFLGVDEVSYDGTDVVILPVSYDAMTSYQAGTRNGPAAILAASQQVEFYDEELKQEIPECVKIFTAPFLEPDKSSPKAMMDKVGEAIGEILDAKKLPIMLGGDHSLSIGSTLAFAKRYPQGGILHLDAHSDLRESWEGSEYSHASSMRHALAEGLKLVSVGVRSTSREIEEDLPKEWQSRRKVFFACPEPGRGGANVPVADIVKVLPEQIYVSIDIDVFDPSIMPAVGTPEPGGLMWHDVLALLKAVARERKVLGLDVMELSPMPGLHHPEFTAARLIAKFLGYIYCK